MVSTASSITWIRRLFACSASTALPACRASAALLACCASTALLAAVWMMAVARLGVLVMMLCARLWLYWTLPTALHLPFASVSRPSQTPMSITGHSGLYVVFSIFFSIKFSALCFC